MTAGRSMCASSSVEVSMDGATTPMVFGNQAENAVSSACIRIWRNEEESTIRARQIWQTRQITNPLTQESIVRVSRSLKEVHWGHGRSLLHPQYMSGSTTALS
jgi:hypothetical protein